jgi:hypothetical protein
MCFLFLFTELILSFARFLTSTRIQKKKKFTNRMDVRVWRLKWKRYSEEMVPTLLNHRKLQNQRMRNSVSQIIILKCNILISFGPK